MKRLFKRILQILIIFPFLSNLINCQAQQITLMPDGNLSNRTEKIFYDASANILVEKNSNQAKYYRIITYKNNKINGPVKDYYMNGKPMMIGYYSGNATSKGNENGKFTWYYENGKVFQTCNYRDGLLNGMYIEYYPSGIKKTIVSYLNGKRYGCEYAWDEEGTVTHRAYMEENGALYSRAECDTAYLDKVDQMEEQDARLKDILLKEYADGEYKEINNSFFYKSKGIKILTVSLFDLNLDTISATKIKAGELIRLYVNVTGLTLNKNNMCECLVKEQRVEPNGEEDVHIGRLWSTGINGTLEIRLGTTPIYDDKNPNKNHYLFFDVRDKKSKASIHGFYRYTVVK